MADTWCRVGQASIVRINGQRKIIIAAEHDIQFGEVRPLVGGVWRGMGGREGACGCSRTRCLEKPCKTRIAIDRLVKGG